MADQVTDFSSALDRVLQRQEQPELAPDTAVTPATTSMLTGTTPPPSPFDDALERVLNNQATPQPPATEAPDALDPSVAVQAASGVASADSLLAEGVSPAVVAEVRRISREMNLPMPLAAQTYMEREKQASASRYRRLLEQNSGLRRLATQGSAYADLKDDSESLAVAEQAFNEVNAVGDAALSVVELGDKLEDTLIGRAITRGVLQTQAAFPSLQSSLELGIALDIGRTEEEILERLAEPYGGWAAMENYPASTRTSLIATARMQYERVQGLTEEDRNAALSRAAEAYFSAEELIARSEGLERNVGSQRFVDETLSAAPNTVVGTLDAFATDPVNGGLFLAETILESAPSLIATILISRVTGAPVLGAAAGAALGGGREYVLSADQFLSERGYTVSSVEEAAAILQNAELMQEAADFGLARAIPIAIFDGLAGALSGVRMGSTALGDVAAQTTVQAASGALGEAAAQLSSEGEITSVRDITIEALAELPTALIEVPAAAGRTFGTDRLPPELADILADGSLETALDQAVAAEEALATARAAVEETATFTRDPEAVRELLEASGDKEVSIPAEEVNRLYQEGLLSDEDIAHLNVEDEMTQQGELSGDVATTASRVLTLQGDAFSTISEHVRVNPSEPTPAEARANLAAREENVQRLQGVLDRAQAAASEVNTLADVIAAEIRANTPLTKGQSRAAARLLAERYAARAALFEDGVTAQELYEQDQVTFDRGEAPLQQTIAPAETAAQPQVSEETAAQPQAPADTAAQPQAPAETAAQPQVPAEIATAINEAITQAEVGMPVTLPATPEVTQAVQALGIQIDEDGVVAAEDVPQLASAMQALEAAVTPAPAGTAFEQAAVADSTPEQDAQIEDDVDAGASLEAQEAEIVARVEAAGGEVLNFDQLDTLVSDDLVPTLSAGDLVGMKIFPTIADRTAAAALYRGIEGAVLDIAVPLLGGPLFPLRMSNWVNDVVWANRGAAVKGAKENKLAEGATHMMVLMGDQNMHISNTTVVYAYLQTFFAKMASDNPPDVKGITEYLQNWQADAAPSGPKTEIVRRQVREFPGFDNKRELLDYTHRISFETRKKLMQLFATKEIEGMGGPPVQRILDETREQALTGLNWGDGVLIVELDRGAGGGSFVDLGTEGTTAHPDFPLGMRGKVVGRLETPLNWRTLWSSWLEENQGKDNPRRAFELARPIVEVTPALASELADAASAGIQTPLHARLVASLIGDEMRRSGVAKNKGGIGPQDYLNEAATAGAAPIRSDAKELKAAIKAGDVQLARVGDARVFYGAERVDGVLRLTSLINNERGTEGLGETVAILDAIRSGVTEAVADADSMVYDLLLDLGFTTTEVSGLLRLEGGLNENAINDYFRRGPAGLLDGRAASDGSQFADAIGRSSGEGAEGASAARRIADAGAPSPDGADALSSRAVRIAEAISGLSDAALDNLGITDRDRANAAELTGATRTALQQAGQTIRGQEGSATTQVATTGGSYRKAVKLAEQLRPDLTSVLDYGAGLGLGSDAMRDETEAQVDSYEPFPERWKGETPPTYTDSADINQTYDAVVSLNVLNVLEPELRAQVAQDIISKLAPNGVAVIGTRKFKGDVAQAKNAEQGQEQGSLWIIRNGQRVYQKGFDGNELVEYLQTLVPEGYTVERGRGVAASTAIVRAPSTLEARQEGAVPAQGPTTFEQPATQTPQNSTPEFRQWFSGSQIVDATGNPLVVYHGTTADITAFDPARGGSATGATDAKEAFFFAASSDVANTYAAAVDPYSQSPLTRTLERITRGLYSRFNEAILKTLGMPSARTQGENVLPVVLSVKNPLEIDLLGAGYNEGVFNDAIQQAKDEGYDGVIFRNVDDQGFVGGAGVTDVYAVFQPNQIKSVFNARPTQAAGLLEQRVRGPQTKAQGQVGAPRGSYTLPTKDDPRNLITLTANSDPSTFVHEVGHMFLFQALKDIADSRITPEGKAQLEAQIAATRSWFEANAEQAFSDLKSLARATTKRAAASPDNAELQLRASRLNAAVGRASKRGGAEYMRQVAQAFMDPEAVGYDEAAEVVYHELWARGFEKYIGTGSAPSAELRTVFAKFAKYIANVYKSLLRLNVTVSPEMSDVFDRLLATEEAIAQERRGALYQLSPEVLDGATPAEANELRRLASEAEEQARTEMADKVENSLTKEARDQRRRRRKELTVQLTDEVAQEPIYAAINLVKHGTLPYGTKTGTGKIDRAELEAVFGKDIVKKMPSGLVSGRTRPDNAIPLSDLATLAGFPDIYSLVEALTNPTPPSQSAEVKRRVDNAMRTEFGDDFDAEALRNQALETAQNDKFQQLQQLQLRILRRLATQTMARVATRQAEQLGAPAAQEDTAAGEAARAEQAAATTPAEGIQASLARIRADVQRTANIGQRRAQSAAKRRVAQLRRGMDVEAINEAAARYVSGLKIKDASPERYRRAASRLTAKIETAIAGRQYAEAASLMEQRALNLAVAKQAAVMQSKIDTQRKRWRNVTRRSDKRLAQSYSIDWVNGIRVLLEPFGMALKSPRNFDPAQALADLQAVEPTLFKDIQLMFAKYSSRGPLAQQASPRAPYKDLTLQEATELLDTADTMLANARDSHGILVNGRRVEFASIADAVSANIAKRRDVQKRARKAERGRGSRKFRTTRRQLSAFKASLRRVELWARDFDNGNPRGPLTQYLVRPVLKAVDAYTVARKGPQEALAALLRDHTDLLAPSPIKADELDGYVFQTKGELIMALLHTGNSSNKRKLLLGGATDVATGKKYIWGELDAANELDTTRWDTFIDRLISEGTITKADMDLVQGIWDIFEQTKKPAQAAHKQMYGYNFAEIVADPVVLPFGTYRGGYAPAITDSMMNPDGSRFEAEEVMSQQSNAAMFPNAERGFTQSRVEYNQPLDLDITRIPAHFDRVMKFAYLGPAVRQAARLATNKQFRAAVSEGSPDALDVAVIPWLQRTVQQRVTTPPSNNGWSGVSRFAAAVDRRVGLHIMAANIVNAAQQVTGFSVAAARIPARHLTAAATRWRVNNQSARDYIVAQSPFMADRLTGGMNEASTTLENILSERDLLTKAQNAAMRYGYFAQQIAQNLVDPTVWLAAERHGTEVVYPEAYAEALERTGDEAAADAAARAEVIEYADSVVRDTQAPLRPSDVSGIEASSPLARLFLKFYSYFNAMGNLLVTEKNIAMNSEMGWAGRYGRSFYAYLMIVAVPSIVAESIAQLARTGFDDLDDDDERDQLAFELLIGSQVKTLAAMVPFAGSIVSTTYGIAVTDQVYDDRISLSAGIGVTESTLQNTIRLIYAAADPSQDIETKRALKTTIDAMGLILGLPTNWASKPISYAASVMEGDSRPEGLVDLVQGALSGRDGTEW